MKYMLLIYDGEQGRDKMTEAERSQLMADYMQFSKEIVASGHYKAGSQLQPTATATAVRVRDGKRLITDGPFAETHEQFGGYFLLNCKDLDEALAWAAKLAGLVSVADYGSIEVRPTWNQA